MPDFDLDPVVRHEIDVLDHQLLRNGVELTTAGASFVDPHVLHLEDKASGLQRRISADLLALAAQLAQCDLIKVVRPCRVYSLITFAAKTPRTSDPGALVMSLNAFEHARA